MTCIERVVDFEPHPSHAEGKRTVASRLTGRGTMVARPTRNEVELEQVAGRKHSCHVMGQ